MMRIQYDMLVTKLYFICDHNFGMDTDEGRQVFLKLSQALFDYYTPQMLGKKKNESDQSQKRNTRISEGSHCESTDLCGYVDRGGELAWNY